MSQDLNVISAMIQSYVYELSRDGKELYAQAQVVKANAAIAGLLKACDRAKECDSLEAQVKELEGEVASLNQRIVDILAGKREG